MVLRGYCNLQNDLTHTISLISTKLKENSKQNRASKDIPQSYNSICTTDSEIAIQRIKLDAISVQENENLQRQYFNRAIAHIASTVVPMINAGATVSFII